MAHFIQLDTETDLGHGIIAPDEPGGVDEEYSGPFGGYMNAQIDWLARDLATVNRSKTPWVIVGNQFIVPSLSIPVDFVPLYSQLAIDRGMSVPQMTVVRFAGTAKTPLNLFSFNTPSTSCLAAMFMRISVTIR
jgi:hypothetical protein